MHRLHRLLLIGLAACALLCPAAVEAVPGSPAPMPPARTAAVPPAPSSLPHTARASSASTLPPTAGHVSPAPPLLPPLPDSPPPLSTTRPSAAPLPAAASRSVSYDLGPGWHAISFPFARLERLSGARFQLLTLTRDQYQSLDAVEHPEQVDTRRGYLIWCDAAAHVVASGVPSSSNPAPLPLTAGWNLVGCPSEFPLHFAVLTASAAGHTLTLEDACDEPHAWLGIQAYRLSPQGFEPLALPALTADAGEQLPPQNAIWLQSRHDCELNVQLAPSGVVPDISNVDAHKYEVQGMLMGQVLNISGSGFGTAQHGTLIFGGQLIAPATVQQWTDRHIRVTLPDWRLSGRLYLLANGWPSNRVSVNNLGNLTGQVQAPGGHTVAGAILRLDTGQTVTAAADGSFQFNAVPAGTHAITIEAAGFPIEHGKVVAVAHESKSVLVTLPPPIDAAPPGVAPVPPAEHPGPTPKPPLKGTLHVVAHTWFTSNETGNNHWWVESIVVQEWGSGPRWSNYWGSDSGALSHQLDCPGARVGSWYTVTITWQHRENDLRTKTQYWTKKMTSQFQTLDFYSPW